MTQVVVAFLVQDTRHAASGALGYPRAAVGAHPQLGRTRVVAALGVQADHDPGFDLRADRADQVPVGEVHAVFGGVDRGLLAGGQASGMSDSRCSTCLRVKLSSYAPWVEHRSARES